MSPNSIKWLVVVLAVLIGVFLILGFLLPIFVKPTALENFLTSSVEAHTDYLLALENPEFSIFPLPSFRFSNVKVWDKKKGKMAAPIVSAKSIRCKLHLFPLLFKQIELSDLHLEGVDLEYTLSGNESAEIGGQSLHIQDGVLQLDSVSSNHWMQFQAHAKWLSNRDNITIRGKIKTNLKQLGFSQTALVVDATIEPLLASEFLNWAHVLGVGQVDKGNFKLTSHMEKAVGISPLAIKIDAGLSEFTYRSLEDNSAASKPADYHFHAGGEWDMDQQSITVKECSITAPFAALNGKGVIDLKARKLEDFQLSSTSVALDNLPSYILPLAQAVPLGLGFSGDGQIDFRFQGSLDQLHVDARIDLTKTLLTYSRYFIKPKSVPLILTTDELLLKHGKQLDGGINIEFQKTKFKGSLVQFDAGAGIGEVTFVTNMFPLEGWQEYLPTFSEYEFSGNLKLFGNVKGEFEKTKKMVMMYHLAFEDVNAHSKSVPPLFQNLGGTLDGGPFELETKDLKFDFGSTHFDVQTKALLMPAFTLDFRIGSPAVDIRNLVLQLKRLVKALGLPENGVDWAKLETTVASLVQSGVTADNFEAELIFEKNKCTLKGLQFDIYGGHVSFSGLMDLSNKDSQPYHANLDIQNISLARMMRKDFKKSIEGNLFLVTKIDGEGFSNELLTAHLKGEGTFSMTNGEFQTFDILGSLGAIAQFVGLNDYVSGTTRFSDVNGKFVINNGKLQTDHILLYSTDFDVDAEGAIDFEGNLNFRLNTVLSSELSRKLNGGLETGERIGPIPIILTGKLDHPSVKPDPALIQEFVGNLLSNKLGSILAKQSWLKKSFGSQPAGQSAQLQNQTAEAPRGKTKDQLIQTGATLIESLFPQKSDNS